MVSLARMTQLELEEYLAWAIRNFAEEKVKSGNWSLENAMEESRREYSRLLPDGVATKNQYLFLILDEESGQNVGIIWLGVRTGEEEIPGGWIWDFMIYEPMRRKGYGRLAMQAVESKARELGLDRISLHVFGSNTAAINLYRDTGYETTNLVMSKRLE